MATHSLKLKPFSVPAFVVYETPPGKRQDGFAPTPGIPLHELSDEAVESLLVDFCVAVRDKVKRGRNPLLMGDYANDGPGGRPKSPAQEDLERRLRTGLAKAGL